MHLKKNQRQKIKIVGGDSYTNAHLTFHFNPNPLQYILKNYKKKRCRKTENLFLEGIHWSYDSKKYLDRSAIEFRS